MANLYDKAGLVNIPVGYQEGFLYNIKPTDNTLGFRFNRDSAATRVNKEGLIEQVGYFGPELIKNGNFSEIGPELVVNGDFATDSDWIKGTGWSISGGKGIATNTTINSIYQDVLTLSKSYKASFTISSIENGSLKIGIGINFSQEFTEVGTYTYYGKPSFDGLLRITPSNGTNATIDNVSVKQVDPNDYWTKAANWNISGGTANADGTSLGALLQSVSLAEIGKKYLLKFSISNYTSGNIRVYYGGVFTDFVTANGDYTQTITAISTSGDFQTSMSSAFNGSITNISVTEVLGDKPRIDYTDSLTSPSFLLEPQSTNLVTFSEDFSQWDLGDAQILSTIHTNPDGTTSAKILAYNGGTNQHYMSFSPSVSSGQDYTFSIFVKAKELKYVCLIFLNDLAGRYFDLENGTLLGSEFSTPSNSKIEDFGNGWYRCSITDSATSTTKFSGIYLSQDGTSIGPYIPGTSTDGLYVWGAQVEQKSYPTSYIPTAGSTVTRAQETCIGAGNVSTFNSTEGVLYAEIAALSNDLTRRIITVTDGTLNNILKLEYKNVSNQIEAVLYTGSTECLILHTLPDETEYNKIAFKYKQNDFSLFVNGIKVGTDTVGNVFTANTLNVLNFYQGNINNLYGKVKGVYVFNEALTDDELQQLTGPEYNSFAALAAAYNYTVI